MSMTCETVSIVSAGAPDGFIVINKSDFKSSDVLFEAKSSEVTKRGRPPNKPQAEDQE